MVTIFICVDVILECRRDFLVDFIIQFLKVTREVSPHSRDMVMIPRDRWAQSIENCQCLGAWSQYD